EEGLEQTAYRLTETFGGVLHAAVEAAEAAVPWIGLAHPLVIEEAHAVRREDDDQQDCGQEHQRRIRGLAFGERLEQPPGRIAYRQRREAELASHDLQMRDHLVGEQAEQHTAKRQPCEPYSLPHACIVR